MAGYSIKRQPNSSTAVANADLLHIYDASDGDERRITLQNLLRKNLTVTADNDGDNVDVTGCAIVLLDTAAGAITISGLAGGVSGQVLQLVKIDSGSVTLQHDNSAGQDILLADEGNQTVTTYGGWTLVCNGTDWFEVGY